MKGQKNKKIICGFVLGLIFIQVLFLLNANLMNALATNNTNKPKTDSNDSKNADTNPPHTPQGFNVKAIDNGLELNWNSNVKEDEVDKYLINLRTSVEKEDSDPITVEASQNSYQLKDLANTFYFVSLQAQDKSGNKSLATPEIGLAPNLGNEKGFEIIGWMPLIDIEDQRETLNNNFDVLTTISPFEYSLEPDGSIKRHGEVLSGYFIDKLKENSKKIIPSITNNFDENDKGTNIVMDWRKRKKNIENIISEVKNNDYDGIDIDYENLDVKVREEFSQYIKALAKELHAIDKILSVTLQAKQSDDESWTQAYDFDKLGQAADQVRIMTYDHSRVNTIPGPIAPIKWMAKALTYAESKINPSKIIAGLPFYAYDWCTEGKCDNRGLVWDGVQSLIEKYEVEVEWDDEAKCPWFYYKDDNGNPHTVYFENAKSISEKVNLIKKLGLGGIAIWRLGNEDPDNFKSLSNVKRQEENSVYNIKVEPKDEALKLSWESPMNYNLDGYKIWFKKQGGVFRSLNVFNENEIEIPNLENQEIYYLAIKALTLDDLVNDENFSEEPETQIVATPNDLTFPDTIKDLKAAKITNTTIGLEWTASGDDYDQGIASSYDIRYSENEINEDNFYQAQQYKIYPETLIPPSLQEATIQFLMPGTRYYLAIKTLDEEKNPSLISNVVAADTIDTIPPKAPSQPLALVGDRKAEISWEKNSEKDMAMYRIYYKQEKSFYNVINLTTDKSVYTLENLENNYHYFVSLTAIDRSNNESAKSIEIEIIPKANSWWQRLNDGFDRSSEKLKAAGMIFGKRLISVEAVPYLVMFSIVIINIFIFSGLKGEIGKRVKETVKKEQIKTVKPKQKKKPEIIDLRKKNGKSKYTRC